MTKMLPLRFQPSALAVLVAMSMPIHSGIAVAQDNSAESKLEIITVKAQKRNQNLQEVPVSVTAFSGEQMAESVIKDIYDLQSNVPGLIATQSQSATNSSFSIRGVGTSSQNFGLESSVGMYIDGVYRARQNSIINNLVDIEAVEVLRGPQGTLFGKNTPSGAILIRSVAPSHDGGDGFVEATVGNFGLLNLSGAASLSAIEDVLAFRITAFNSDRDGIVSDINLGEDVVNDRNRWGARLQALYTPNNDVSVRIIADHSEIDEICCASPVFMDNYEARDVPGRYGTDYLLTNVFNAHFFAGGDDFYNREIAVNRLPVSTIEDSGLSMEIDWQLNENLTFVSISASRSIDSKDAIDADFTDVDILTNINDSQQSSFSQELRLDYSKDKLNVIVGTYYFQQDLDLDYALNGESQFEAFYNAAVYPQVIEKAPAIQDLLDGLNNLSTLSGGLIAPAATPSESNVSFPHIAEQEHESFAVFGQFDYALSNEFTLTAGLRYTEEEKDLYSAFAELNPAGEQYTPANFADGGVSLGLALQNIGAALLSGQAPAAEDLSTIAPLQSPGWGIPFIGAVTSPRPDINEKLEDNQITGTVKLSYQPSASSMYYALIGTGYKSGGTNTDRLAEKLEPVFNAEKSTSIEAGMKKDFPAQDLRLNAAIHKTDISDFQANTFTGTGFNLQNAGDLKTSGAEIELTWLPSAMTEINFSYAYVKAEFDTFLAGNCWLPSTFHSDLDDPGRKQPTDQFCDRSGDRVASQPEHYAILKLKQDIDLSSGIYSYLQVELSHTSDQFTDGSNDPLHHLDAYNLVNLRFFMNFSALDLDVILWGRNILDEEYLASTTINTPVQDGKISSYVAEPATFGLTVKKRF
ncbi:TonB-dependent receptor [Paraglaciecola aquimarina]|uniref:TonB-dependent receptor n=1 Tax=Paraglaciecola aquimarina TaxID=1235557 RepID=A0ABU3SX79_9ALTE|nr:TonB-dependent receptor [Paraglaciecola aquimarina]MDU0354587.1 TonB-dependent receptor [Paraglaciecola aquimarina]